MGIAELDALVKRYRAQERRADRRTALICCTVVNAILRPDPPWTVEDYFPTEKEPQTPEQQLHALRYINAALGGEVH